MAMINKGEAIAKPGIGSATDTKADNFSPEYVRFITTKCRGELAEDGVLRNPQGARYCSCEMCGRVATSEMMGKFYCDYHFPHRGSRFEESVCTQWMHRLRPLLLIEAAARPYEASQDHVHAYESFVRMYDEECRRLGMDLMTRGQTMSKHISEVIERQVVAAKEKAAEKVRQQGQEIPINREDFSAKLKRLRNKLSMSQVITINTRRERQEPDVKDYPF